MTDSKLRELERRFRSTGRVVEEAGWLRARLQTGELEQSRLELAAYCAHPASRLLLGANAAKPSADLDPWLEGLSQFGRHVLERSCVAMARMALSVWERRFSDAIDLEMLRPFDDHEEYGIDSRRPFETVGILPVRAIEQMEDWIQRRHEREALVPSLGLCESFTMRNGYETAASCAVVAVEYAHSAVFRASDASLTGMSQTIALYTGRALLADEIGDVEFSARARRTPNWPRVHAAVCREIDCWALNCSDPVRERVESRQREAP